MFQPILQRLAATGAKVFSLITLVSLFAVKALAADFYECRGFADTPEYRAGINVPTGQASFFDNDTTSGMSQVDARTLYANPPEGLMVFEGPDAASQGSLRLEFDRSRLTAALLSIDSRGHITELGLVPCKPAKIWQ